MTKDRLMTLMAVLAVYLISSAYPVPASWAEEGVEVSGITQAGYLGFLSMHPLSSPGKIVASDADRIMLSEGDTVSVKINEKASVHVGDSFTVCRVYKVGKSTRKGTPGVYVIAYRGRLVLKEQVKSTVYRAEIVDSVKSLGVGDPIIPYEPVSPCVKPVPSQGPVRARITALQENRKVVSQHSVVYLPVGYSQGLRRGNILQIGRLMKPAKGGAGKASVVGGSLGYMLVLETRPDTATAVVLTCLREFYPQEAYVKDVEWSKAGDMFSKMPSCTLR